MELLHKHFREQLPEFDARLNWLFANRPDLAALVSRWRDENSANYTLLALMRRQRLSRVLARMLDETEFLSDYGIRSLSKVHLAKPASVVVQGETRQLAYAPGEGTTRLYGGNSNWRGPIWMPVNFLIIGSLRRYQTFYGDELTVEYPAGSGQRMTLGGIADSLSGRLKRLFLRDTAGRRAYLGESALENDDPNFRDRLLFHEHFHGDTGRGLGAAHQTGWTGLIALLLHPQDEIEPERP